MCTSIAITSNQRNAGGFVQYAKRVGSGPMRTRRTIRNKELQNVPRLAPLELRVILLACCLSDAHSCWSDQIRVALQALCTALTSNTTVVMHVGYGEHCDAGAAPQEMHS